MKQSRFAPTLVAGLFCSAIPHTLLGTTTNLVPIADTACRYRAPARFDDLLEVCQVLPAGPAVKPFEEQPFLIDLAPTILAALDAPATRRMIQGCPAASGSGKVVWLNISESSVYTP